ncbi:MAG: thioredoxin family protein [Promethearchaeota archaeon]|jgi:thioredoxin
MLEITDSFQFYQNEILDISNLRDLEDIFSKNPDVDIVMDFWAEWCSPCKAFSPIFKRLHEEYGEHFIFAKVNVERDKKIKWKYNLTSIPTCIIFKNGRLAYMCAEIIDYPKLKKVLDRYKDL